MIDFHTHILPGMDDGSRSVSESLALLEAEARQGVTDIVLTPHYYAEEYSPADFLEARERAWKKLQPHLTPDHPNVLLGAEVQYFEGICSVRELRNLCVEGTDLLLLEMPFCRWSSRMINDILELNSQLDMNVVLAHVDRYVTWQGSGMWKELKSNGVLLQANVSFFGNWKTRFKAMRMVARGEIDFLGSDCHNMGSRKPNWDLLPEKNWESVFSRSRDLLDGGSVNRISG